MNIRNEPVIIASIPLFQLFIIVQSNDSILFNPERYHNRIVLI